MSGRGNRENVRIAHDQQEKDFGYTREPEFTVSHVIHTTKYGSEVLQGMKTGLAFDEKMYFLVLVIKFASLFTQGSLKKEPNYSNFV